jgi:acetyltransferase
VELFRDRSLGLPPLNTTLARRMIERTVISGAFKGIRGRQPIDTEALEQLLVHFSQLVVEQGWIKEIDINPLLASPERLIALDARVVLHDPAMTAEEQPRLAIRPYPRHLISTWTAADGTTLGIRPLRPEDEPLLVQFHASLSDATVYARYFDRLELDERTAHERLARICFLDYDRELALVAGRTDPATGGEQIVGIGRLSKAHARNQAEFAVLVSDAQQRRGIGTELLRRLIDFARAEGLERISGQMLADNEGMRRACERLGFELRPGGHEGVLRAELVL